MPDEPERRAEPPVAAQPGGQDATEAAEAREAAEAGIAVLEDQLLRTAADLDNLRKRYQRDLSQARAAERAQLAAAWLPVVDNLELALQHADSDPEGLVKGVRVIREQAVAALARLGYPAFDPVGQPFDPVLHEAVSTMADEAATPGTVVAVVRPGYGTPDALLRPAAVVVARR